MRVLVLWADNHSANLGVRVLAQGTAALLRHAWGDDLDLSFQDFSGAETGMCIDKSMILRDVRRRRGPLEEFISQFDAVVDTGAGDSFTDIYGAGRLVRMAYVQRLTQRLGIPVVMSPQTIGPFESRLGRHLGSRSLRHMATVLTRDETSEHCARSLGRAADASATDVVFALPQVDAATTRDILLNVSGLLWHPNPHVDHQAYRRGIAALISRLTEQGRQVTLFPHVLSNDSTDDDVKAIEDLGDHPASPAAVLPQDLDDARRTIASSKLVIGSRMHACLNALSLGVPAIPWAYSRKFAPLLTEIGWGSGVDLRQEGDPVTASMSIIDAPGRDMDDRALLSLRERADEKLAVAVDRLQKSFTGARS